MLRIFSPIIFSEADLGQNFRSLDLTVKHFITQNLILSNFSFINDFAEATFLGSFGSKFVRFASVGTRKRAVIEKTLQVNSP